MKINYWLKWKLISLKIESIKLLLIWLSTKFSRRILKNSPLHIIYGCVFFFLFCFLRSFLICYEIINVSMIKRDTEGMDLWITSRFIISFRTRRTRHKRRKRKKELFGDDLDFAHIAVFNRYNAPGHGVG